MNLAQIKRRAWKETLILFILAQYKKIIQKLHDFVNLVQQMCSKKKKIVKAVPRENDRSLYKN